MIKGFDINKHLVLIITCLVLFATLMYIFPQKSEADESGTIRLLPAKLPTVRDRTAAIWDGEYAYIFCGDSIDDELLPIPLDEIIKFDQKTKNIQNTEATLPIKVGGVSAIWDGNDAYIFGGESWDEINGWQAYDEIVRYNPNSNTTEIVPFVKLPSERFSSSAIFDGRNTYIFGGYYEGFLNEIIRYNISSYSIEIIPTRLPANISYTSAVWDGKNAYIFGGTGGDYDYNYTQIIQFNPDTESIRVMNTSLPGIRQRTSAIWDGNYAYIFGGVYREDNEWKYSDEILRYDPENDNLTIMPTWLPTGREGTSAVWTGERVYIFGGYEGEGHMTNQILEYTPPKAEDIETNNNSPTEWTYLISGGFVIILLVAIAAFIVLKKRKNEN